VMRSKGAIPKHYRHTSAQAGAPLSPQTEAQSSSSEVASLASSAAAVAPMPSSRQRSQSG
jgi:hypothetical protein